MIIGDAATSGFRDCEIAAEEIEKLEEERTGVKMENDTREEASSPNTADAMMRTGLQTE